MAIATGTALAIGAGLAYLGGRASRKAAGRAADQAHELAEENMRIQNEIMEKNLAFQKEEAAKLEKQKEIYRNMEFKNPYENVTNQFAENVYEDLKVDTQAAEFQMQQAAQARADIMGDLAGAAGGSGIAALAQTMANQATMQAKQVAVDISQQERQNQMMERKGEIMKRQGAGAAEMARLGGEAGLQEMEMSRQATLLGIQMGQTSGANQAVQQSYANQMAAGANQANMFGQQAASLYSLAGQQQQSGMNMLTQYAQL